MLSSGSIGAVLLLSLAASALGGCAFLNVDVHPPELQAVTSRSAEELVATPGRGREVIVLAPFGDERSQPSRCGLQKNGYGQDTADVVCTEPPGRWFSDQLADELTRAGFRPLRSDAVPGPDTVVVHGDVLQLFLEPVHNTWTLTVEGDFSALLDVKTASGLHARRTFFVKGEQTNIMSTTGTFQGAADHASHDLAQQMVLSLTELLDRYPSLGAPTATRTAQVGP